MDEPTETGEPGQSPEPPQRPSRLRTLLFAAGGAFVLVALVVALTRSEDANRPAPSAENGAVRDTAPAFAIQDLHDREKEVSLVEFEGRPVVLNFFASWCEPCKRELPVLQRAHERAGDEIAFIGVDHQDSRSGAIDLLEEFDVSYTAGYDPEGNVAEAYRVTTGLPVTFFITADGRIAGQHFGEISATALDGWLGRLRKGAS